MKKRMLALGLALTLTLSLTPAFAAGTADKFPAKNTWTGFSDVADNHWALTPIKICYETGLMNGKGAGFDPDGTVTIGEAVTVAARVGAALRGDTIPASTDGVWYSAAATYFRSLPGGEELPTGNLEQFNVLRRGLFSYLSTAVPENALIAKNSITSLPDPEGADVLRFYNAGVLTGLNGYGTFAGSRILTRAEMAAMVSRIVRPETALAFTPKTKDGPDFDPIVYYTSYKGSTPVIVGKDVSVNLTDYLNRYIETANADPTASAKDIRDTTTATHLRSLWDAAHDGDVYPIGDLLGAKHILVDTKEEADALRAQLKAAGDSAAKFDELMVKYSTDPGLQSNPDGYTFGPGEFVAEFESATKALSTGQISEPVQSGHGWHIILRIAPSADALREQAFSNWWDDQDFQYTDELRYVDLPAFYRNYMADLAN